ncbi:class I adenylate-forming enzyme family protein [Denitrificimonas sp. JX-1]|uniref:Class I adenylate-forming enzyme family protein n=1 Tax=Denitrificimonas halotolerans TaxID=3098930 RepID=A0ABU5GNE3_9GAMM|nr:class I adenylate-forming enzyme family protein [Denitrificimonas sp. JX-1]MDY7218052.1 class I adenylate-forming enzyme family protein [Denitrificimonas sp. JX-1]
MTIGKIESWRKAWQQLIHEASPFAVVRGENNTPEFSKAPFRLVDALQAGREFGEKPFVLWEGQNYTYGEFYTKSDKLTAALQKDLAVQAGDRVAIAMRNRPAWMISCMAAVQSGAVPVPINSWSAAEELVYAIQDCGAKVVFCDPQRYELLKDLASDVTVIVTDEASLREGDRSWNSMLNYAATDAVLATPEAHDPALILYTSGTTGQAKGVLSSNKAVCQALYALDFQGALAYMTSEERVKPLLESGLQPTMLLAYPMFHVSGLLSQFMSALRSGRRLVIMYKWDVDNAIDTIRDEKITQFAGVPMMMQQLIHSDRFATSDTDTLFALGLGGSGAPRALLSKLLESKPMALSGNGYGMTESNGICSAQGGNQFVEFPESAGWPLPIAEVVIGETPQASVPVGTSGPIWLRTSALMDGYWNKPEDTREVMQDGWFFTGDVGYLDEHGMLYITDRIKDIIIRGGENISAVEVEHCACEHPAVEEAAVFSLPDDNFGEQVAMVVYAIKPLTQEDLTAFMAERLAHYKLPAQLWFSEAPLARNATGKILKAQVKKEFSGV